VGEDGWQEKARISDYRRVFPEPLTIRGWCDSELLNFFQSEAERPRHIDYSVLEFDLQPDVLRRVADEFFVDVDSDSATVVVMVKDAAACAHVCLFSSL
jgi:hypothetical protein